MTQHEHETSPADHGSLETDQEIAPAEVEAGPDPPMIYVASLSDYNAGQLHGTWIVATQDLEQIDTEIYRMLSRSQEPIAEEYVIHDSSGFGAWRPDEYESLETVTTVAEAIVEHRTAVTHWIDYLGTQPERAIDSFENAYLGNWASMVAYAENLAEDLGVEISVDPPSWEHYVKLDVEALSRDLEIELHSSEDEDGSIHIFDPSAAD